MTPLEQCVPEEMQKLVSKVAENFDKAKALEDAHKEYEWREATEVMTIFGDTMCWDNPNLVWVFSSVEGGGYEEYGAQLGISRKGKLMYEYQSHCSCNDFGDSSGDGQGEVLPAITTKTYEVSSLPKDWEKIVMVNCVEMLRRIAALNKENDNEKD